MLVVAFDALLEHLAGLVPDAREDRGQRGRVRGRAVGRYLVRDHARGLNGATEGGRRVRGRAPLAHVDVDHLAVPVAGAVDGDRLTRDLRVGLIDALAAPHGAARGARGVLVQRGEFLDPVVDG